MPAVDRQRQGTAHSDIVERLPRVVRGDHGAAIPVAFLHGDLVAQRSHKLVARRRRKAAEFDRRPVGFDRSDPDRLLVGENADEAIQIRQSRSVVVGVAHAGDRLPRLVVLKAERTGTHDVLLEPMRVAIENVLLVNEGVWIGECRQKCGGRELEMEDDGLRVGCLDLVDHRIVAATHADHAFRRIDDHDSSLPLRRRRSWLSHPGT